jgi:hypothetical protein
VGLNGDTGFSVMVAYIYIYIYTMFLMFRGSYLSLWSSQNAYGRDVQDVSNTDHHPEKQSKLAGKFSFVLCVTEDA